jgi:hypothetical protein
MKAFDRTKSLRARNGGEVFPLFVAFQYVERDYLARWGQV